MASAVRDARVLHRADGRRQERPPARARRLRPRPPAGEPHPYRAGLGALRGPLSSDTAEEWRRCGAGCSRYWERSPTGTRVSMSLLSTREARMSVMARGVRPRGGPRPCRAGRGVGRGRPRAAPGGERRSHAGRLGPAPPPHRDGRGGRGPGPGPSRLTSPPPSSRRRRVAPRRPARSCGPASRPGGPAGRRAPPGRPPAGAPPAPRAGAPRCVGRGARAGARPGPHREGDGQEREARGGQVPGGEGHAQAPPQAIQQAMPRIQLGQVKRKDRPPSPKASTGGRSSRTGGAHAADDDPQRHLDPPRSSSPPSRARGR